MVVQVGHKVQPDHVDPVGHEVQVEHVQGPQCNRGDSEDGQHALQEGVGGLDLHAEQQASAPCTEQQHYYSDYNEKNGLSCNGPRIASRTPAGMLNTSGGDQLSI